MSAVVCGATLEVARRKLQTCATFVGGHTPPLQSLAIAARDNQCFACDPAGIRRSQKNDGRSDVVWLPDSSERALCLEHFLEIASKETACPYAFGFNHTGIDGVDADFARSKLFGQRFGDCIKSCLCRAIN